MASIKEQILEGLKPALTLQIRADLDSGKVKQPVDIANTTQAINRALKMNVQTAGAMIVFGIKEDDITKLVTLIFEELKVEIK